MQVAVLGAGTMGHGIAQVSAMAGHDVWIRDIDESIVERFVEDTGDEAAVERDLDSYEDANIRVDQVDVALAVTEDSLLLSLPDVDGRYDARTEFVVEHDRGRQWGIDLFEAFWADAEPLVPYVRDRYL